VLTTHVHSLHAHEVVDQYDSFQPVVETYVASLPGQPIYTQMIHWVQLRCNAYWNAVVRTTTGVARAHNFAALFNDIQGTCTSSGTAQTSIPPRKYLADLKLRRLCLLQIVRLGGAHLIYHLIYH
jgi:hypothetical protein